MNAKDDIFGITEDRIVERLLERLNEGVVPSNAAREDDSEVVLHEYTELLGLLPYELAPIVATAAAKENLMQTIRGRQPTRIELSEPAQVVEVPASRWLKMALPLAASIAIVLLGVVGWQSFQMAEQISTIDQLGQRLSQVNIDSTNQLAEFEIDMNRMQDQLALVTSRGVEVCTLHPKAAEAAKTGARGALFVAADRQRWYLRIDDLEPCPQGRTYQLWFVMANGPPVNGGILEIEHGVELEVTSDTMPDGTVAVNVTLEPAGGSEAPSGPSILYGDEVMRIL